MEQPSESIVWEGNPSQVTNLGVYIFCVLIAAAIVPIVLVLIVNIAIVVYLVRRLR